MNFCCLQTLGDLKRLNFDILSLQQSFISSLQCSDPIQANIFLTAGCNNRQHGQLSVTNSSYGTGLVPDFHSVSSNSPPVYEDCAPPTSFSNNVNHHNPSLFLAPPPPSSHKSGSQQYRQTNNSHARKSRYNQNYNNGQSRRRRKADDRGESSDSMEFGSGMKKMPENW